MNDQTPPSPALLIKSMISVFDNILGADPNREARVIISTSDIRQMRSLLTMALPVLEIDQESRVASAEAYCAMAETANRGLKLTIDEAVAILYQVQPLLKDSVAAGVVARINKYLASFPPPVKEHKIVNR